MTKRRWFCGAVAGVALAPLTAMCGTSGAASTSRLSPPGCTTAVASGANLAVTPQFASVPGEPFDVATTPDGRFTFVSSGMSVLVYAGNGAQGHSVAAIPMGGAPYGMALTEHGTVLLVSMDDGIAVVDVKRAERGGAGAVVTQAQGTGSGGIEVAPTPDGRFALESMEETQQVDLFRLSGERTPQFVGSVRVGALPVGIAYSPDGKTAYVTSEEAHSGDLNGLGTLTLLNVARAEEHPAASVEHTVVSGCAPVRVVVSPDGATVWVTARESDAVLGFSAADLAKGIPALVADVAVGPAPVGLALFDGGRRMLVADSNRFGGGNSSLAVLDLTGDPTLIGYLRAGGFPRQMTLEPGGNEMDVTNYASGQLETVPLEPLVTASH